MIKIKLQKNITGNKGYTLLFAVLVSSLVLAIGVSILTIAKKEFLLATSTRDSSSAFYAADSGIECAVYGEFGKLPDANFRDAFNTSENRTANIGCEVPLTFISSPYSVPPTPGEFVFHAKFSSTGSACAVVTVKKTIDIDGIPVMDIDSRGYNTGWSNTTNRCETVSTKRVERAIHIKY